MISEPLRLTPNSPKSPAAKQHAAPVYANMNAAVESSVAGEFLRENASMLDAHGIRYIQVRHKLNVLFPVVLLRRWGLRRVRRGCSGRSRFRVSQHSFGRGWDEAGDVEIGLI